MRAWLNGSILEDPAAPAITVQDHGLTVGDGVFEAVKVVDGAPFALTRHLDRLARSADGLGLTGLDLDEVRRGVAAVLAGPGRCRWAASGSRTPGEWRRSAPDRGDSPPTLVVVAAPMDPAPASTSVVTVPWPRNERGALAGLKTTSYAENVVALALRRGSGAPARRCSPTWPATCARAPAPTSSTSSTAELRTPTLASGCLAGVTRALLLEWSGAREVDEPLRGARAAPTRSSWSPPRATSSRCTACDDRHLPRAGPGDRAAAMKLWAEREPQDIDP